MEATSYWHPNAKLLVDASTTVVETDASGSASRKLSGIPHIIHQIWLGSKPPKALFRLIKTWKRTHPDWKYILWDDEMVKRVAWGNQRLIDAATNLGEVSDILRYEILYACGGVYLDTDMQCIKRLDALHDSDAMYIGLSNTAITELNNAVIGCQPGDPLMLHFITKLADTFDCKSDHSGFLKTIARTGPGFLTRTVCDLKPTLGIIEGTSSKVLQLPISVETLLADYVDVGTIRKTAGLDVVTVDGKKEAHLRVLSKEVFYPVPNNVSDSITAPALCTSDEAWDAILSRGDAAAAVGAETLLTYCTKNTLGIHWWAKTWQRSAAQISHSTTLAEY